MSSSSDAFLRAAAALDGDTDPTARPPEPSRSAADEEPEIDGALVWEALSTVIDPEIGLDIVTLGLVYELEAMGDTVRVTFSLTTPGCPMEEAITNGVVNAVSAVPGVGQVVPNLVWEPRWHSGMIQEGAW
jgi:metal-sulfur cluster biosynthetic enzyme